MELPAMDNHKTLKLMMDSLFSENMLKNWSIFADNKNGATVLKIRFTKPVTAPGEECTSSEVIPIAFKRKSVKQSLRDHDRKVKHENQMDKRSPVITRSMALDNHTDVELPRVPETDCVSEPALSRVLPTITAPVLPVAESVGSPDTIKSLNCESSFDTSASSLNHSSADNNADTTDRWCSILNQYKNIEPGREVNVYRAGNKCSECLRPCDLESETHFEFQTLSCNLHNAIVCTDCYPRSGHILKCKMKKVKFRV